MFFTNKKAVERTADQAVVVNLKRKFVPLACCAALLAGMQCSGAQVLQVADRTPVKLTLPAAVRMAMQHNRHLQLAQLGTADAEQKEKLARSDYFPHIKNESTALHVTELEGVVIPVGAFAHGGAAGLVPSETVRIGQGGADTFTSGTGLVQPITQLLRVNAAVRAAKADVAISRLTTSELENNIALQVHKMYYAILTKQIRLAATAEGIKASDVTQQESEQAVSEGHALELAKLESHASLLEAQQSELTQQLEIDDLMMQFDDVLGLPLGTKLDLDADQLGESPALPTREEALVFLKAHNHRVLEAQATLEKAKAAVSAAKDAYIPDITGLARYSYQSGVPFLVHNFGTFGGAVSYDLFDGGARESKLKRAKIEQHIAEIQLAQAEADASVEVAAAYDQIYKLEHLLTVVSEVSSVRDEAARISKARVTQKAALASESAKAEAEVATARASVLEVKLGVFLARNQVKQLLGQLPN